MTACARLTTHCPGGPGIPVTVSGSHTHLCPVCLDHARRLGIEYRDERPEWLRRASGKDLTERGAA